MRLGLCLAILASLVACHGRPADAPANPAVVGSELDAFVRSYASALVARDVDRVVAFYEPGVAMLGHNDGVAYSTDGTIDAIKKFIAATRSITIDFDTVAARPITGDLGIVWTTMRESWVDVSGTAVAIHVLVTCIAQRRDGRWRFIYYDGRHVQPPALQSRA